MNPLVADPPLKRIRSSIGLVSQDINDAIGIPRISLNRYEHGLITPPDSLLNFLSANTKYSVDDLKKIQAKWIKNYRELPHYPDLYTAPVGNQRGRELVRDFVNYVETIRHNVEHSKNFQAFITETFTSQARCAKILKVAPSALQRPATLPVEMEKALHLAGFEDVATDLKLRFFRRLRD